MKGSSVQHLQLTRRDAAMVVMAHEYGGVSIEQLRRRFFTTPGARSACYARVGLLEDAGYLSSIRLPSETGQGSGRAFLRAGPAARPLLIEQLELERSQFPKASDHLSSPFVHHHLEIGDFRI